MKKPFAFLCLLLTALWSCTPASAAGAADPHFDMQRNLAHVDFPAAWEKGYDGRGVRIAVIDSGIYAGHEDLAGSNILQGVNVIDRSADISDTRGTGPSSLPCSQPAGTTVWASPAWWTAPPSYLSNASLTDSRPTPGTSPPPSTWRWMSSGAM